MKKIIMLFYLFLGSLLMQQKAYSHCQMPCGIYDDAMMFDVFDQYVTTMVKAISMLEDNHFKTPEDHNQFTRWVLEKERASDDIANLITCYFLQQKIQPNQPDTVKKLVSAHKMLFYLVQIKQNVDLNMVKVINHI